MESMGIYIFIQRLQHALAVFFLHGRKEILRLNGILNAYAEQIRGLQASVDSTELPRLEKELNNQE